jgi:hypothetical protein
MRGIGEEVGLTLGDELAGEVWVHFLLRLRRAVR